MNLSDCIIDYLNNSSLTHEEQLKEIVKLMPRANMKVPEIIRFWSRNKNDYSGSNSAINKFKMICPELKVDKIFWKDLPLSSSSQEFLKKNNLSKNSWNKNDAGYQYWVIYYKDKPSNEWIMERFKRGFQGKRMKEDVAFKLEEL